jgi:hypothetical protein
MVPASVVGNAGVANSTRTTSAGASRRTGRRQIRSRTVSISIATANTMRKLNPLTPTHDDRAARELSDCVMPRRAQGKPV